MDCALIIFCSFNWIGHVATDHKIRVQILGGRPRLLADRERNQQYRKLVGASQILLTSFSGDY